MNSDIKFSDIRLVLPPSEATLVVSPIKRYLGISNLTFVLIIIVLIVLIVVVVVITKSAKDSESGVVHPMPWAGSEEASGIKGGIKA